MCQHGWGKFQREDAAAALSYLNLAEDQRLDRERQICWKKKKVGNWRCGPALVLLFQAPHSPARNCAPYQIPTNCWVSQKHHHQQRASALATDMVNFSSIAISTKKNYSLSEGIGSLRRVGKKKKIGRLLQSPFFRAFVVSNLLEIRFSICGQYW